MNARKTIREFSLLVLLFILCAPSSLAGGVGRAMDPLLQEEFCKNFTYGNPVTKEFFSPGFPRDYPPGIKCFRTISADYGYFVKVDFQNWDFLQSKIPILNKNRFGLLTQKLNKSVQNPIWIFNIRIINKCNQWAWNIQTCLKVKRRVMKYLSHTTSHIGCDIW